MKKNGRFAQPPTTLRTLDNSLLLRHYFLSHFVREITVRHDLAILQTSDCSRTCRRTALSSRSPSRRSRCGTGSCRDSYRRAKGPRRRPQEWIGSLASLGIMPGTPSILEVLNVAEGPLPFNLGRNLNTLSWRSFFSLQPSASWMSESERFMSPRSIRDSRKRSRSGILGPEEGDEGSLARAPIEER